MDIRPVTEDYSVSGQIEASDVPAIAAAGFRTIICHRPDAEDGAVAHEQVEEAAKAAGLGYRYIPVISGQMTEENIADMAAALDDTDGPVFAYCRSGARSTSIYMAAKQAR